jgi:hypothetical protein
MKLEFQTRWLRVLIEFWPTLVEIRRHHVIPRALANETGRLLRRQIAGRMRRLTDDSSP